MVKSPLISKTLHPSNIFDLNVLTDEGIEISVKFSHLLNAKDSIDSTDGEIITLRRFEQLLNAYNEMHLMFDGIVICSNELHPENAPYSILVAFDGIVTSFNEMHPSNKCGLIEFNEDNPEIFVKEEQSLKHLLPIYYIY